MTNETQPRVLVVDDEPGMRHMLRLVLGKAGYPVEEAANAEEALRCQETNWFPVILCDIRMPKMDGLTLLPHLLENQPGVTVIMMSAYGSIDQAVQCLKLGAYDYISKPFQPDEVVLALRKAEERRGLLQENRYLRQKTGTTAPEIHGVIAVSPVMQQVMGAVSKVADSPLPVLITGETGTGKEVVARAVHEQSPRSSGDWIAVNCGAISPHLMESELFGHVRGAFTGAERNREGLFSMAHGGTLFLDEIGELPLDLQPKLLRVLQEAEIRRVGDSRARNIDVRILAATSRDLQQEVQKGRFREDLLYRLNTVELYLPPLRERRADIPALARKFADMYAKRSGQAPIVFSDEVLHWLDTQDWPGNARELQNTVEKLVLFRTEDTLTLSDLPRQQTRRNEVSGAEHRSFSLKEATRQLEIDFILRALDATGGNRTRAAELLEISLRSLQYKIRDYDLS